MSSFDILHNIYYKTNTDISFFFRKENQNKFADSPVFLTRPKEKKKKGKKKKSKKRGIRRRKQNICIMNFNPRQGNYNQLRNLNFTYLSEVFSKEIKTIITKPTATLSFFNRIQTKAKIELSQLQPT